MLQRVPVQDIRHDVVAHFLVENEFYKLEQLRGCADDVAQWTNSNKLTDSEVSVVEKLAREVTTGSRKIRFRFS